jgi:hypothetical protein
MAYTKGDWVAHLNGKASFVTTHNGKWLADCGPRLVDNLSRSEVEANAQLFAAAPDLLAACEAALEWVKDYTKAHPMELGPQWTLYEQLEIAIKKAQGS